MNYFNEIAYVKSNILIAENTYKATLKAPKISKISKPGQFVNILPSDNWEKAMRRPMSLAGVNKDNIELIYKVFGNGTYLMSKWSVANLFSRSGSWVIFSINLAKSSININSILVD